MAVPPATAGLTAMTLKIEERKRKRKLAEAGLLNDNNDDTTSPSSIPPPTPTSAATIGETEWKPAPGESPADREKRIKREKRAERLAQLEGGQPIASGSGSGAGYANESTSGRGGRGVSFNPLPLGPTGTSYTPPQQPDEDEGGVGSKAAIHPSRLAAPALAREIKEKVPKEPREKTSAKKKYLKRKRVKAKAKTKSAPKSKKARLDGDGGGDEKGEEKDDAESDDEDSSEEEWEKEEKREEEQKKKLEIIKKKEERKIKRDAKKAELRKLKQEGVDVKDLPEGLLPKPRVKKDPVPQKEEMEVDLDTGIETETEDAVKTAEQLELEAEREVIKARQETKRLKRLNRNKPVSSPPPPSNSPLPSSSLLPITDDNADTTEFIPALPHLHTSDPVPLPAPQTLAEPLLRLPSATRPAPPSAAVLNKLNVHASVRDKVIVDRDVRVAFKSSSEGQDGGLGVSEKGVERLEKIGVTEAFAVQTAVLPLLLPSSSIYTPFKPTRDLCVSAPTGSGKTLSYVIPIVETLRERVVTRLRALIILPTRDLVGQVKESFESFGKGSGLKVGIATGQHSFNQEQVTLVGEGVDENLQGGSSQVDILIATPGRLMDHLQSTKGFTLQHLRFLVVDEADRLLNQSFHDWLPVILESLKPKMSAGKVLADKDALAPDWWDVSAAGKVGSDLDEACFPSCQKLLFSATLSRDPAKIDALHLYRPIYISVEDSEFTQGQDVDDGINELNFTFPSTLKEQMIFSPASHKPLYLFHLLHTLSSSSREGEKPSILCFTKSVEAAKRLGKLVEFFEEEYESEGREKVVVSSYSSDLPPSERNRILRSFKQGETQMLVASDLIARGIDLPLVTHVISYDVPADMQKYVHRVGRTARAGREGEAWSLVEDQEAAPFKAIMNSAQHWAQIKRVRVKDEAVEGFVVAYQAALVKLRSYFSTSKKDEDKK